jgi:type I restriction enzyme S subunit
VSSKASYVNDERLFEDLIRPSLIRSRRFVFDVGVASPGGAGRNRVLNRREFLEIIVRLPGIDEQHRTARVLNDCDRELDLLTAQREQVEIYRHALLSKLLSGDLVVPSP